MQVLTQKCKNCGYEWFPRVAEPWKCPRCQSPLNPKRKKVREAHTAKGTGSPQPSNPGG